MKRTVKFFLPLLFFLSLALPSGGMEVKPAALLSSPSVRVKGKREALKKAAKGESIVVSLLKGEEVRIDLGGEDSSSAGELFLSYLCRGIIENESDYRAAEARYPLYVQIVFDEKPDLSFRKSLLLFWRSIWNDRVWTRKSIVYAFTNRMPRGSVVNSEKTVALVSVGDETDVGREVRVTRDIARDFTLAYGAPPRGKIYRVVVGFDGPAKEGKVLEVRFDGLSISSPSGRVSLLGEEGDEFLHLPSRFLQ
ncbi:MAG: DUF3047 domain-containing protein [Deltaproteobacteria bacterium]|nr:MAG: DUF3047 domain-containing protein [Deltaproteobacteria bacterium]